MLSLRTREDWVFDVEVTVGMSGPETWSNTATCAVESLDSFVAWLTAPARAWGGAYTASWVPFLDGWGWAWRLTCSTATTIVPIDPAAYARLVMITDTGTIHGGEGAASGTWWPVGDVGIREWLKHAPAGVDGGGTGALRVGVPGLALYRPQVEALATMAQRERMREILAVVEVPRVVYLWDRVDAVWRRCHLGSVGFAVAGPLLSRVTFEVLS